MHNGKYEHYQEYTTANDIIKPSGQCIRLQYFSFFWHVVRGLAVILMPPAALKEKTHCGMETTSISCLMPRFRQRHHTASRRRAADPVHLNPRCRDQVATWRLQPQSQDSSSARASLSHQHATHTQETCARTRARTYALHCTSDMKQIRFTPRTPECDGGGGLPVSTRPLTSAATGASESDSRASHAVGSTSFSRVELQYCRQRQTDALLLATPNLLRSLHHQGIVHLLK